MRPIIAVFGSSTTCPGEDWFDRGIVCGRLLAEAGFDVATGGYGGLMEAVSRGASAAGARVFGVTAPGCFPDRPGANRYVDEEIPAPTITERIHRIESMAAGFVVLDGSIGTLTELLVVWNVAFIARFSAAAAKPVVAVGERWGSIVPSLAAAADTPDDVVTCVPDVARAVAAIVSRVPAV
jgi:uncharacterized protein (TIGR00725 family)